VGSENGLSELGPTPGEAAAAHTCFELGLGVVVEHGSQFQRHGVFAVLCHYFIGNQYTIGTEPAL